MSADVKSLQSPQWKPIYHQGMLFSEDQLKTYITPPTEMDLKAQTAARIGMLDSGEINFFERGPKALKPLKARYPYIY